MDLSLLPEATSDPFQEQEPTLLVWPARALTSFCWLTSHIYISPFLLPTHKCDPFYDQATDVT